MDHLNRHISLGHGVGILVTVLLGTGVFVIPQLTVEQAGTGALWAWGLIIAAMVPVTLVFAGLGAKYPHAGGPSFFVEKAFNPKLGKAVAFMFLLIVPVGAPAAIEIVLQFFRGMVPVNGIQGLLFELCLLVLIFAVNYRGLTLSASIQSALSITVLLVLVVLLSQQLGYKAAPTYSAQLNPLLIVSAIGLSFWSFLGIETMSHLSEEFKNPQRDFKRALILGLLIVGFIYFACTWLIWSYKGEWASPLVMVDIFNYHLGAGGQWVIGFLGLFSGIATVNIYVASIARLAWSLSREGNLPARFARLNRYHVPSFNLVVLLMIMAVVLTTSYLAQLHYESLIRWTNGVFVFIYLISMLASFRLLPKNQWWMSSLGTLVCVALAISLGADMLYAILLLLFIFFVINNKKVSSNAHSISEPLQ